MVTCRFLKGLDLSCSLAISSLPLTNDFVVIGLRNDLSPLETFREIGSVLLQTFITKGDGDV